MPLRLWSAVKWASLAVSVGSIVLAVVYIQMSTSQQVAKGGGEDGAQTNVESPQIVEREGERIIWRLQAKQAKQQLDGKMYMVEPVLTLYTDKQVEVPVQSQEAWFDPVQRSIRFAGKVEVHYQQWLLQSDALVYDSHKDELRVPNRFVITGKTLQAKGKGLRLQRETQRLWVDEGIWIRDESAAWKVVAP